MDSPTSVPPQRPRYPDSAPLVRPGENPLVVIPIHLFLGFLLLQLNPSEFFPNLFKVDESHELQVAAPGDAQVDNRVLSPAEIDASPPDLFADPSEDHVGGDSDPLPQPLKPRYEWDPYTDPWPEVGEPVPLRRID